MRSLLLTVAFATTTAACFVGFHYRYDGTEYTMTRENSEYHEHAVQDVRQRYGDPKVQTDLARLKGACELLQKYATAAPDPGSFTGARELLDHEARATCERAHVVAERDEQKAEMKRRQDEADRARAAREAEIQQRSREQERSRLTAALDRDAKLVEICEATSSARVARKRHAEILQKAPGATVRKECTPRMEMETVKAECKDANGFTRACTKQVSTGEVASYTCPKTMDAEVVQLGLFELRLLDSYPFPEDRNIRVRDSECEEAHARLQTTKESLDRLSTPAASLR